MARHDQMGSGSFGLGRRILTGAAAGAAGTTALNLVTYVDMALRARPASEAASDTIKKLAARIHASIPGDEQDRENRVGGLGGLMGIATGVSVGVLLGAFQRDRPYAAPLVDSLLAMLAAVVASNGPMTALRVTDPRRWTKQDWLSDIAPHLAYGAVAAAVLLAGDPRE